MIKRQYILIKQYNFITIMLKKPIIALLCGHLER